jgi:hypothetical protein
MNCMCTVLSIIGDRLLSAAVVYTVVYTLAY